MIFARSARIFLFNLWNITHPILLKSTKDIPNNKSIAFKTTLFDFRGICLEEDLPYPLFRQVIFREKNGPPQNYESVNGTQGFSGE